MPTFRDTPVDVVIDVRSKLEYWLGHIPGALSIAVGRLPDALLARSDVSRDARIVVYCASGARSARATAALRDAGYRAVTDAGGMASARRDVRP